jgi:long-chain acyl-CoA synthetase
MKSTVRSHVDHQATIHPEETYFIAPATGLAMSFGKLQRDSIWLTRALLSHGAAKGDKVALLMPNGYQTCRLLIGIMYGGFCATPINCLLQPTQLAYIITHCSARIIFVSPSQEERLNIALTQVHRDVEAIVVHPDCPEFIEGQRECCTTYGTLNDVAESDDALMMYISDNNSIPKGILLNNRSVIARREYLCSSYKLGVDERIMAVRPLNQITEQIIPATPSFVSDASMVRL